MVLDHSKPFMPFMCMYTTSPPLPSCPFHFHSHSPASFLYCSSYNKCKHWNLHPAFRSGRIYSFYNLVTPHPPSEPFSSASHSTSHTCSNPSSPSITSHWTTLSLLSSINPSRIFDLEIASRILFLHSPRSMLEKALPLLPSLMVLISHSEFDQLSSRSLPISPFSQVQRTCIWSPSLPDPPHHREKFNCSVFSLPLSINHLTSGDKFNCKCLLCPLSSIS